MGSNRDLGTGSDREATWPNGHVRASNEKRMGAGGPARSRSGGQDQGKGRSGVVRRRWIPELLWRWAQQVW